MNGVFDSSGLGANLAQQVVAGHRLHVPVRDHQPVFLDAHLFQRRRSIAGIVDIFEAELLQEIPDECGSWCCSHQPPEPTSTNQPPLDPPNKTNASIDNLHGTEMPHSLPPSVASGVKQRVNRATGTGSRVSGRPGPRAARFGGRIDSTDGLTGRWLDLAGATKPRSRPISRLIRRTEK